MTKKKNENLHLLVKQSRLSDVMGDIARFDNSHRTFSGKLVRAGQVVVIKANNKTVRVIARGAAGLSKGEISLSSETRSKLGLSSGQSATFTIAKANLIDDFLWAWQATDAMPRVAARLGVISVVLGLVGALFGIASMAISVPIASVVWIMLSLVILAVLFLAIGYCWGAAA